MIDLSELKEVINKYLATLSKETGEDWYDSYHGFASHELGAFLTWLEARQKEPQ